MNLSEPIRTALLGDTDAAAFASSYSGSRAIFTRRPVPPTATYPMILVSPDIAIMDQDGISDKRPIVIRDISIYDLNDDPDKYRAVEAIGYVIRTLFHRNRRSITVSGWNVISIVARGPQSAPVDDDKTVGRVVSLTVSLSKL